MIKSKAKKTVHYNVVAFLIVSSYIVLYASEAVNGRRGTSCVEE